MPDIIYLSDCLEFKKRLIDERLADIERIKAIFDSVMQKSVGEWVCAFLAAENPHKEINQCLNIAELFDECTAGASPETCKEVFKRLVQMTAEGSFVLSLF